MPGFLVGPNPALGLDTAARGTKDPPVFGGGAIGREPDGPFWVSSKICRVLSLKMIGSF